MKRDMELVRMILLESESSDPTDGSIGVMFEGYDQTVVDEHVSLLIDAGLLLGHADRLLNGRICSPQIVGLTWAGHEFLAAASEKRWALAKEHVLKPGFSITFDLLLQWLKDEAKKRLLLP